MSGGAYDYFCLKLDDFADEIEGGAEGDMTPLRALFVRHIRAVAKAARAVEWVDSCDYVLGGENGPIIAALESGRDLLAEHQLAAAGGAVDVDAAVFGGVAALIEAGAKVSMNVPDGGKWHDSGSEPAADIARAAGQYRGSHGQGYELTEGQQAALLLDDG